MNISIMRLSNLDTIDEQLRCGRYDPISMS